MFYDIHFQLHKYIILTVVNKYIKGSILTHDQTTCTWLLLVAYTREYDEIFYIG